MDQRHPHHDDSTRGPRPDAVPSDPRTLRRGGIPLTGDRRRDGRRGPASGLPRDPITGLPTAAALDHLIECGRLRSDRRASVACLIASIDNFEDREADAGRPAAQRAARSVAEEFTSHKGPSDLVFRLDASAFCVLRAGGELGDSWAWAEDLRAKVRDTRLALSDGRSLAVTLSIGLHALEPAGLTHDAIELAETACSVARERGGDQVCTWDSVVLDRICDHAAAVNPTAPGAALADVCRRLAPRLGPWQHRLAIEHGDHAATLARLIDKRLSPGLAGSGRLDVLARVAALASATLPESLVATPEGLPHGARLAVRSRAQTAARLAARLGLDEADADCVRLALERFDAADDEQHLGRTPRDARVIGVALACAAMLEARPFRAARPAGAVIEELHRESGGQFAADAARAAELAVRDLADQPVRVAA